MLHRVIIFFFILFSVSAYADALPRTALHMPLSKKAIFLDIEIHKNKIYAVGERGIILRSKDQGESWEQVSSPVDVTLTGITFSSDNEGWIVGHESTILHSSDGGDSWAIKRYKPEEERFYMAVKFFTPMQGYVLATDGELWQTEDGGKSWDVSILFVEEWYQNHLFSIEKLADSALVVAERGGVFHSKNGRSPWLAVPSPYEGSYFGVSRINDNFLLYGMSGQVYLLNSVSLEWSKIDVGTDQFLLSSASTQGNEYEIIVGRGGTVVFINKEGRLLKKIERNNRMDYSAVASEGDNVYLASMAGGIEKASINNLLK